MRHRAIHRICISCAASNVSIEVRFVQVDPTNSAFEGLVTNLLASNPGQPVTRYRTSLGGILTSSQFRVVQKALNEGTNGATLFVAARVTTASGRHSEVEMTEMGTNVEKDILEFNLRLAITPTVSTNGYAIQLHFSREITTSLPYFKHPPPLTVGGVPITTLSDILPPSRIVDNSIDCTGRTNNRL